MLLSNWGVSKSWNVGSAAQQLCLGSPGISHANTPRLPVWPVRFALRCVKCQVAVVHSRVTVRSSPALHVWPSRNQKMVRKLFCEHWGLTTKTFQLWYQLWWT